MDFLLLTLLNSMKRAIFRSQVIRWIIQSLSTRIAGQIINIGIDSTETVDVKATYPQMATDYTVKGSSENEKIKELALKQIDLQARCQSILAERPDIADSIITVLMNDYKQDVSRNYILRSLCELIVTLLFSNI